MGSPKTQTVGGGSATPVANSWNQFLQGQLYQQPGAQAVPQTAAGTSQPASGFGQFAQNMGGMLGGGPKPQATGNPAAAPGQFQQTLQGMMNPDINGMIQNNPFLSQMQGYNPMAQLPNAPNLQGPNMQSIAGGYNPAQAAQMDPMSLLNGIGSGQNLLQSYGINLGGFLNPGSVGGGGGGIGNFTPGQLKDASTDPSFQAIQQIADRQKMNDVANLRARYGMGGNTQSSGASLAESQYLAEANPRLVAGLGDLTRQIQGLDLQQQQINNQGRAAMGAGASSAQASMNADASRNLGTILDFIQGTRGQDIGASYGLAGQNLGNQQSANNLNASNFLQAMGMDNQNLLNLFGQNSSNALNLFGQQSQNALNNQNMSNNWMSNLGNMGMGLQQLGAGQQQNMMNNLFNSFNQSNQIGNPQAQTVQTPSAMSQMMGLASMALPFIPGMQPLAMGMQAGNMMGGMNRPTMAAPQLNNPFMGSGQGALPSPSFSPFQLPNYNAGPMFMPSFRG